MSLTNILKRVLDSSPVDSTASYSFFSDKTGGNNDYYHHEPYKKLKSKSKSEKKRAILSALTLLAFLFFLNILQNCIREQSQTRESIMLFGTYPPQAKYQVNDSTLKENIRAREKRSLLDYEIKQLLRESKKSKENENFATNRKSRNLFGFSEQKKAITIPNRHVNFIHRYITGTNRTNIPSQISYKDSDEQKLKAYTLNSYWKSKTSPFQNETDSSNSVTAMNLFSPKFKHSSLKFPFRKRKIKKKEGTSTDFHKLTTVKKVFNEYNASKINRENSNFSRYYNSKNSVRLPNFSQQLGFVLTSTPVAEIKNTWKVNNESTTNHKPEENKRTYKFDWAQLAVQNFEINPLSSATITKNMKLDYSGPLKSPEYKDHDQSPTPTQPLGLDLNTFQTYPIPNYYYNYRLGENEMTENPTKHEVSQIDRMDTSITRKDAQNPLFYPTHIPPHNFKYSQTETKNSFRHPGNKSPNFPSSLHRYRYSPYRKAGSYELSHLHDSPHKDYIVVARYPHEEHSFDFSKFLWVMFTSLARPLTNLVPELAKDNNDNPQCYDLLVCEAQRVSKFMGPTAEALTTTLGTLLSWAVTEDNRQMVIEALNSGRENTCQQQIKDCEDRYGGKSAMTVIAQAMEIKLR